MNLEKLPKFLFLLSLSILIFTYGYFSHRNHFFPYSLIIKAAEGKEKILSMVSENKPWYYIKSKHTKKVPIYNKNSAYEGSTLITSVGENDSLSIRIINMDGVPIHKWEIDWFDIWSDATHIADKDMPKARPGAHIHGVVLLNNGDLVFNFEHLGLVRLDVCGNVVWRLPYRTHHSIYQDEYNNLWVSGQKNHEKHLPGFPNYKPPFIEPTILKISTEGKILNEISVMDLLKKNDLQSLLYMSSINNASTEVSGDTLHLNDIETFPSFKEEGFFKAGDIMISLRNISTILIFREDDLTVKNVSIGGFVRQHDPDFIDGNTISIFDNNNVSKGKDKKSRILIKSFSDGLSEVHYSGNNKPFYTHIMGKHQWLQNGNLLITEAMSGRALEIDKKGETVWEYFNIINDEYLGIMEEAQRLPDKYTKEFFEQKIQTCKNKKLK